MNKGVDQHRPGWRFRSRGREGDKRPAPGFLSGLRVARRLDECHEVGDGRVRRQGVVVDEDPELLLDDAEKLDPTQRIEIQVARERGGGFDRCRVEAGETRDDRGHGIHVGIDVIAGDLRCGRGDGRRAWSLELSQAGQDVRLADLQGVRPREVRIRPWRGAADLLVGRETPVSGRRRRRPPQTGRRAAARRGRGDPRRVAIPPRPHPRHGRRR